MKKKRRGKRLTLNEIDEDFTRDPPQAYNPNSNSIDRKSMTQQMNFSKNFSQLSRTPAHERLYEDARLKEVKQREYESIK